MFEFEMMLISPVTSSLFLMVILAMGTSRLRLMLDPWMS
jgi:hypothetical protein